VVSRPIPEEAPVMMATLPCRPGMVRTDSDILAVAADELQIVNEESCKYEVLLLILLRCTGKTYGGQCRHKYR